MQTQLYERLVDKHREEILAAEDYIWRHPETGFREWKTTAYMQDVFEKAGYTLVKAGDIPGFYTDIETGRPGPKLLIMAELDALSAPNHVQAVDGCAHACGHHAQCAAMAGIALALKEPGALDGLSGSVRLMCVPAEELIELDFRDGLRRAGVIHYLGGKTEFMHRGYMDGVDLRFYSTPARAPTAILTAITARTAALQRPFAMKASQPMRAGAPKRASMRSMPLRSACRASTPSARRCATMTTSASIRS